ncbi:hypothetical protein [Microbulbifer variabilis]|uniref:Transcriptional regulator n=1 Tax=Microbulbifer variabilis TaxID=266805 RepID=A0ABY4VAF6_9GAMM|nr:hypothetical protein [Microbulbifer variabilis]USD21224.1 hypothetical protein MJO52_19515 [Microbulbifer variabilis]
MIHTLADLSQGAQLRLQFEAISQLPTEEKEIVKELLNGMIIKYQSRRWDTKRQVG